MEKKRKGWRFITAGLVPEDVAIAFRVHLLEKKHDRRRVLRALVTAYGTGGLDKVIDPIVRQIEKESGE